MSDDPELLAAKWRVWDQAWEQSRHLEMLRGQYLGYFFTAILGVAVFLGKDIADGSLRTVGSLVVLAVVSFLLDLIAAFLLLAVARIGDVLLHYGVMLRGIQDELRTQTGAEETTPLWLRVPTESAAGRRRLRSTQGAAEAVLQLSLVAFPMILIAPAARSLVLHEIPVPTKAICLFVFLAGCAVSGVTLRAFHRPVADPTLMVSLGVISPRGVRSSSGRRRRRRSGGTGAAKHGEPPASV
jgi:hypothetical protein